MRYLKLILIALCLITLFNSASAQQTAEKYIHETRYLLSLPEGYEKDTNRKWPMVMFLHGSGESGSDLQKVKAHGPPKMVEQGRKFPFILVSPQSDFGSGWNTEQLYQLLLDLKKNKRVDEQRI